MNHVPRGHQQTSSQMSSQMSQPLQPILALTAISSRKLVRGGSVVG
ncbi:MAG: hypothetical protein ACI8TP_002368 [Acidimicrobiales bacterium]|jgi:hypothetical protein